MNYAFFSKRDLADGTKAGIVLEVHDLDSTDDARATRDQIAAAHSGIGQLFGYMEASLKPLAVGDQVYPTSAVMYDFRQKMADGSAGELIATLPWIAPTDPTDDDPDGNPGATWPLDVLQSQVIAVPSA